MICFSEKIPKSSFLVMQDEMAAFTLGKIGLDILFAQRFCQILLDGGSGRNSRGIASMKRPASRVRSRSLLRGSRATWWHRVELERRSTARWA